jgi:hypothetical protein
LRIDIGDGDAETLRAPEGSEMDDEGGFSRAAFLLSNGDNFSRHTDMMTLSGAGWQGLRAVQARKRKKTHRIA